MSQADVIRAFLQGGKLQEATLRTDGKHLFSGGRLIAERRDGRFLVMEDAKGANPRHVALVQEFIQWREQRDRVLQNLLDVRELIARVRAQRTRAQRTARQRRGADPARGQA